MQWILAFMAALDPTSAPSHLMPGNYSSLPVVIARYSSEQDCNEGLSAYNRALVQNQKLLPDKRVVCVPVGKAIN